MKTIFVELVRRFNEDNNEEAAEHWTVRDRHSTDAELGLRADQDQIRSGSCLL